MAQSSSSCSEDQLTCCICLDIFTNPVSTPCGHNFCMECIGRHWDQNNSSICPLCKYEFYIRPDLHINKVLAEIADECRNVSLSEASAAKPGDVVCDFCPGRKLKAVKSCLVCLASYCEMHVKSHSEVATLRRHTLVGPIRNLEERLCSKHERLLELFCTADQACICSLCAEKDHQGHSVVSIEKGRTEKMTQLRKTQTEIQRQTQERLKELAELNQTIELVSRSAQRETAESKKVFDDLMDSIQKKKYAVVELIEAKEKTALIEVEGLRKKIQQEISELRRQNNEIEQLSETKDNIQFLKNPLPISVPCGIGGEPRVPFNATFNFEAERKAVSALKGYLEDIWKKESGKISKTVNKVEVQRSHSPAPMNKPELSAGPVWATWTGQSVSNVPRPRSLALMKNPEMSSEPIWATWTGQSVSNVPRPRSLALMKKPEMSPVKITTVNKPHAPEPRTIAAFLQEPRARLDVVQDLLAVFAERNREPATRDQGDVDGPSGAQVGDWAAVAAGRGKKPAIPKKKATEPVAKPTFLLQGNTTVVPKQQTPESITKADFAKYFHQLTFDPNTTNKHILLSEENRKATWRAKFLEYPDHPERFDGWNQLLSSEGLVGKRYYWEVECTGKEIEIGVAYKGIARKEWNDSSHIGRNLLSWSLEWNQDGYFAWHNNEMSSLSAPRSQKLGVYLDYPAGTLSFYSITDTITLLHRYHTTFTEPLYAGFKVGYVSSAQICARVNVLCHRYT
ncbi:tripartite motif-containing protein 16-like isoform X1 [Acipenser ruthenus]|uniref:tripartite motif-containing protein 16-like isoform X1 n=1 Tax=Acipenser ruthenus TaxID=7906 RepID=UPI00274213A3|nr:tripartite motif-containing protein 16-like isoform X1 [Acipenser ruthenus]